jgi:hypothetical protein
MSAFYGNFPDYYQFNDCNSRLSSVSESKVFTQFIIESLSKSVVTVIDIGCNSGDLTIALYDRIVHQLRSHCKDCSKKRDEIGYDNDREESNIVEITKDQETLSNSMPSSSLLANEEIHSQSLKRKRLISEIRDPQLLSQLKDSTNQPPDSISLLNSTHLPTKQKEKTDSSPASARLTSTCPHTSLPTVYCLGVDLDTNLINRAKQQVCESIVVVYF